MAIELGLALRLGGARRDDPEAFPRVAFRQPRGLDPVHEQAVLGSVHVQVEPVGEEVIMVRGHDVLGHEPAVGAVFPVLVLCGRPAGHSFHLRDAGGADHSADGPVGLKDPVEDVVVIAEGGDPTQDEVAAGTAVHDGVARAVAPRDFAAGPLEEASDGLVSARQAALRGQDHVEPGRVVGAIGPAFQRPPRQAHGVAELAAVEERALVPAFRGVHVGHEDLGNGALIEDGPRPGTVDVADVRDHGAPPRLDPHVKTPAVPAHLVAVTLEAGTHRLLESKGWQRIACGPDRLRVIVDGPFGDGDGAGIDDPEHLPFVEVDVDREPFDLPAPGVLDAVLVPAGGQGQPPALVLLDREVAAGRPPAAHGGEVGDPTALQGLDDLRALLRDLVLGRELLGGDVGLDSRHFLPRHELARRDVDDRLDRLGPEHEDRAGLAPKRGPRLPGQHLDLGRFTQRNPGVPSLVVGPAGVPDDVVHHPMLGQAQAVEGMLGSLGAHGTGASECEGQAREG